ncbi:6-carboxytetrahydropterin synthase [Dehalococcoidales bacterium]|nr:6-carboxytetrahydropterin synthase [Dehalococcoidales bacterium]MCL0053216.1 6-carboxytetrahydropterin synthase [Dehalococcoidales bacterium]MCL0094909.1 6-carboxytetrahydropterin synthase [Dehalococcoidales bacterium]
MKLKSSQLDDIGIAYDFTRLKQQLGDILSKFDHIVSMMCYHLIK